MRTQYNKIKNLELSKTFFYWKQYLREKKPVDGWGENLLFGNRNHFWLFDINLSILKLYKTFSFVYTVLRRRGRILFINGPEDFEEYWEKLVYLSGHTYYKPKNWLVGGLTNKTLKFYQRFSLVVLYNTDLGIVSECLKLNIPMVYFGDINSYPQNIDYPLGFCFKTKEQVFWYFQAWRNLFKKTQNSRPYFKQFKILGYRKFILQLASRKLKKKKKVKNISSNFKFSNKSNFIFSSVNKKKNLKNSKNPFISFYKKKYK